MTSSLVRACALEAVIRQSRFRADAAPIDHAEAAFAFLDAIRDPDATHQAWAFRIGPVFRSFDDGEPGGTAGRPILGAIESLGFDRVMVVVSRWYGGVKLGAGGLARAYGGTAANCLRAGDAVEIVAMTRLHCHAGFADLAIIRARLATWGATQDACTFDAEGAQIVLSLPTTRAQTACAALRDLTRGQMPITREDDGP